MDERGGGPCEMAGLGRAATALLRRLFAVVLTFLWTRGVGAAFFLTAALRGAGVVTVWIGAEVSCLLARLSRLACIFLNLR